MILKLNIIACSLSLLLLGEFFVSSLLFILGIDLSVYLFIYIVFFVLATLSLLRKRLIVFRVGLNGYHFGELIVLACIALSFCFLDVGENSKYKLVLFIYLAVVPFALIFIFFSIASNKEVSGIITYLHGFAAFSILWALLLYLLGFYKYYGESERITFSGIDNPIWSARFIAVCMLILLVDFNKKNKIFSVLVILVGFYLIVKTGARAPLLSMVIAYVLSCRMRIFSFKLLSFLIFGLFGLMVSIYFELGRFSSGGLYSVYARINEYSLALSFIKENYLFGFGYGNYSIITTGEDGRYYPHNIFLEFLFEMGVVGLICFIIYMVVKFNAAGSVPAVFASMFYFYFFNSLFSGDIPSNSMLFVMGFLIAFLKLRPLDTLIK